MLVIQLILKKSPHWYASLGVGESIDHRAKEGSYVYFSLLAPQEQILVFSPNYHSSLIYFQGKLGYTWVHPFIHSISNNLLFPFMSLGVAYRHTKPTTSTTELNAIGIQTTSEAPTLLLPYRIEQDSVLQIVSYLTGKQIFINGLIELYPI